MRVALLLHVLAVVFWVGGMAFAHIALRPALADVLQPPQRLALLDGILRRFFAGVILAILVIFVSGGAMLAMAPRGVYGGAVHAMIALAVVMAAVFAYVRWRSYPRLRNAVAAGDWPAGGAAATTIRRLVAFNLVVGVVVIGVTILGH
ncbi:MAG: CopD family protein [Casimicrobiaceae bacterium]